MPDFSILTEQAADGSVGGTGTGTGDGGGGGGGGDGDGDGVGDGGGTGTGDGDGSGTGEALSSRDDLVYHGCNPRFVSR